MPVVRHRVVGIGGLMARYIKAGKCRICGKEIYSSVSRADGRCGTCARLGKGKARWRHASR